MYIVVIVANGNRAELPCSNKRMVNKVFTDMPGLNNGQIVWRVADKTGWCDGSPNAWETIIDPPMAYW